MPFSFAETLHYSQFFSSYQKIPSGLVDFSIAQHVGLILGPFRNPLFPSSTPTTTTPPTNLDTRIRKARHSHISSVGFNFKV